MTVEKVVGLLGWPTAHSLSPVMQNAAFKALGLDEWIYLPMPVNKFPYIRVKEAVLGLRALSLQGANVTVPYKEAVLPYMEKLSEQARIIGAVNTIAVDGEGRLVGHNTDGQGFINDLTDQNIDPTSMDTLLLGAGGSARAISVALLNKGSTKLTILNRTKTKADDIANYLRNLFPKADIMSGFLNKEVLRQMPMPALVINCTSVGLTPNNNEMAWDENLGFSSSQVVYDTIYNPQETRFLRHAKAGGAQAISGLGMLVHQGALSFKIWTGQEAPLDVMKKAVVEALSQIKTI
jgi:shikimate dehydrogenase